MPSDMEFADRIGTIVEIFPCDEWGDWLLLEVADKDGKTEGFQQIYDPEVDIVQLHGRWRQFRFFLWRCRHPSYPYPKKHYRKLLKDLEGHQLSYVARTKSGKILTDDDMWRLAEEAEKGYNVDHLLEKRNDIETS